MSGIIDCLFIGHNEMRFEEYEKFIRRMGTKSPAYRDLNLNFVRYKGKPYSAQEAFNLFRFGEGSPIKEDKYGPLSLGNNFSSAISYLGTYLHRRGFTFDFVNSFQNEKQALIEKLQNEEIRTIAIPTTLYVSVFPIIEIMTLIRKYNKTAKVIMGGPFVSTNIRNQDKMTVEFLFESIDADFYVNSSQGEAALVNILNALKNNLPYDGIKNIYYRQGNKYIATPSEPEDNRLEENMVDWNLFKNRHERFATIRSAISCPFSCAFCGFPEHAGKYQTVSVGAIENELNKLNEIGNIKSIYIIDDTFNVPLDRYKDILRMMIKNKYGFNWHSYFRCQYADEETIELMKESGCEGVFLGIESGNQNILDNMNKKAAVEKYRKGLPMLKEYGIITFASFITGFPGETYDTYKDTVSFIEEHQPDFYRTQLWYCEPITAIYKQKDKYNIKGSQFEWSHATMDANTGSDLVDEMFLNVKNSIWMSQYNFDFPNIFYLLHRDFTIDEVKAIIKAFNMGMKDKFLNTKDDEMSDKTVEELKKACRAGVDANNDKKSTDCGSDFDVAFDF